VKFKAYRVPEKLLLETGPNPPITGLRLSCWRQPASQAETFYSIYLSLYVCVSRTECCKCSVYFNVVADDVLLLNRPIRDVVRVSWMRY